MRFPPYYRSKNFQHFFSGFIIGMMISWIIFLFIYGKMQEEQVKIIHKQEEQISDLKKEKEIWQEDFKRLNEKNKRLLTVQDLSVKITNAGKFRLDALSVFEVEESVKEDLSHILAKDLHLVYNSRDLLEKVIENKQVQINDRAYRLKVRKMVIYTTFIIELELILEK